MIINTTTLEINKVHQNVFSVLEPLERDALQLLNVYMCGGGSDQDATEKRAQICGSRGVGTAYSSDHALYHMPPDVKTYK